MNARVIVLADFPNHCEHPPLEGVDWDNYPMVVIHHGIPFHYSGTIDNVAFYYRRTEF